MDSLAGEGGQFVWRKWASRWRFAAGATSVRYRTDRLGRLQHGVAMDIRVTADHTLIGTDELSQQIRSAVERRLQQRCAQIERIDAHLGEGASAPEHRLCAIEVRLRGCQPFAVSHADSSHRAALSCALDKLISLIECALGTGKHVASRTAGSAAARSRHDSRGRIDAAPGELDGRLDHGQQSGGGRP